MKKFFSLMLGALVLNPTSIERMNDFITILSSGPDW